MTARRRRVGVPTRGALWAAAAVAAAISFAPASLLGPALRDHAPTLEYERLDGTIWRGAMRNVHGGGVYVGDLKFRLTPLGLLGGALAGEIEACCGFVTGEGRFRYGLFDSSLRIRSAEAAVALWRIQDYSVFGLGYSGEVLADVKDFRWTPRKGCAGAQGTIETTALDAAVVALGADGLTLAGPLGCEGGALQIALHGGDELGDARITIEITPALAFRLNASVASARADIAERLRMIGFQTEGGELVYTAYGPLKGLQS